MNQVKQRCSVLEDQLVDLVVLAMERSENDTSSMEDGTTEEGDSNQLLWQHLSSQLIFFVLFQFARFPHMVNALFEKVSLLSFHSTHPMQIIISKKHIMGQ